jgi:hypothetical protein
VEWWETHKTGARSGKEEEKKNKPNVQSSRFELSLPEHLPSSPLCPKNSKIESGRNGICLYHGRKRSVNLKITDSFSGAGDGAVPPDDWEWSQVK